MDGCSATADVWYDNDSPYAHLLHTNRAPSPAELQGIRAYLLGPKAKLQRLEAEIERMRAIVEGLESQQAKLKEFVDSHKAILSPIKRIPPELLQEIFVRCLSTERNCVLHACEAPLLLIRICSEWRNLVLSTPELWSSLHISIPRRDVAPNPMIPRLLQQTQIWLARSGTCPLSISLYIGDPYAEEFPPIADLLAPLASRFRSLELAVPANFPTYMGSSDLPILEEIIVRLGNSTVTPYDLRVFSILKQMPLIRRVTMGSKLNIDDARFLPLSQLHGLRLECAHTLHEILNVLKQCRNLQQFSLATEFFEPFTGLDDHLITLPHLRTLSMQAEDMIIQALLQSLTVPRLQELSIDMSSDEDSPDPDCRLYPTLRTLITRSSCILKSFRLPYPHTSLHDGLEDCLSLMPQLTTLEMGASGWIAQGRGSQEPFLEHLIPKADNSAAWLLPNLQRLQLRNHGNLSNKVLLDFIKSRRRAAPPGIAQLVQVYVKRWDMSSGEDDLSPDILALREDGLDIVVRTDPLAKLDPPPFALDYSPYYGL